MRKNKGLKANSIALKGNNGGKSVLMANKIVDTSNSKRIISKNNDKNLVETIKTQSRMNEDVDNRCAPTKEFIDGSCYDLRQLAKIKLAYNEHFPNDRIKDTNNKEELVKDLEEKFTKKFKCDDQQCWLNTSILKNLNDKSIKENVFRPKGPSEKNDWLSNFDIIKVMNQYESKYKDFKFLGAVPYDFEELEYLEIGNLNFDTLVKKGINRVGLIINLDEHNKPGSHWVSLFIDFSKNQIYFSDSVGTKPGKRIREFIKRVLKYMLAKLDKNKNVDNLIDELKTNPNHPLASVVDVRFNSTKHQNGNTECGVYSINFILRLLDGEKFENIKNELLKDDIVQLCRKVYFS